MAISLESLPDDRHATRQDIQAAPANLAAPLGNVTLKPRDGILWAHAAPNAKGLTEVRPLDRLRIISPFSGSGGSQPMLSSTGYSIGYRDLESPISNDQYRREPPFKPTPDKSLLSARSGLKKPRRSGVAELRVRLEGRSSRPAHLWFFCNS